MFASAAKEATPPKMADQNFQIWCLVLGPGAEVLVERPRRQSCARKTLFSQLKYTYWDAGAPGYSAHARCAALSGATLHSGWRRGEWSDEPCLHRNGFVCETHPGESHAGGGGQGLGRRIGASVQDGGQGVRSQGQGLGPGAMGLSAGVRTRVGNLGLRWQVRKTMAGTRGGGQGSRALSEPQPGAWGCKPGEDQRLGETTPTTAHWGPVDRGQWP